MLQIRNRKDNRNRCWVRERKCISTLHSTNYATTQQESRRTAKICQNQPFWTKWIISHEISFARTIPQTGLRVWIRRSVCRGPFQNPSHDYCVKTGTKRTTFQMHIFARIPANLSRSWKRKKPSRKYRGLSSSVVIFLVWKPQHPGKLEQKNHEFANKRENYNVWGGKVLSPARCDRRFNAVFRVSRNLLLPEQNVPWWSGITGFSSMIDYMSQYFVPKVEQNNNRFKNIYLWYIFSFLRPTFATLVVDTGGNPMLCLL